MWRVNGIAFVLSKFVLTTIDPSGTGFKQDEVGGELRYRAHE